MSWDQWLVLTCGVSGVFLAQTTRFQKYACFPGIAGQAGWFAGVSWATQPGIFLVCVLYSAVWIWGLWNFWIGPWLDTVTTPTDGLGGGLPRPSRRKKPNLQLVSRKD